MERLFFSLGIDWKLLISQGVNFLILLALLTFFVWRPLLELLASRRRKIELGVEAGEIARQKLAELDELKKKSLARSEREAEEIIKDAEREARDRAEGILTQARARGEAALSETRLLAEREKAEALSALRGEARHLIKKALVRMVELDPKAIDAKLVAKAAEGLAGEINQ